MHQYVLTDVGQTEKWEGLQRHSQLFSLSLQMLFYAEAASKRVQAAQALYRRGGVKVMNLKIIPEKNMYWKYFEWAVKDNGFVFIFLRSVDYEGK